MQNFVLFLNFLLFINKTFAQAYYECPNPDWILGSYDDHNICYTKIQPRSNIDAVKSCRLQGGRLLIIDSNEKANKVIEVLSESYFYGTWVIKKINNIY
jgi:hypothetical protein